MSRRGFLTAFGAALLPLRRAVAQGQHGVHGMIVLPGADGVWLSHLPLFRAPHAAQLIVRAKLDQAVSGDGLFTFEPERFDLDALLGGTLKTMKGTLVRGHFERGGTPIAKGVSAAVTAIVYAHRLDARESRPARLRYLLFGAGDHLYAAHLVTRPPDFEHILRVRSVTPALDAETLARGQQLIVPGREDVVEARLSAEKTERAALMVVGGSRAPERPVEVSIGREIYFETGDLAS